MSGRLYQPTFAVGIALFLIVIAVIVAGCTLSAPAVKKTTPGANAKNVAVSPPVVELTFNHAMRRSDVENAISVSPSVGSGAPTYAWTSDDKMLTITFPQPFAPNTSYTVTIGTGAKATNDVALGTPFVLKFTTGPASPSGAGPSSSSETMPAATAEATTSSTTTSTDSTAPAVPALTFTSDIKPLAEARCKGCHGEQMTNYDNIIAKKYVTPGKPDQSRYYLKPSGKISHGGGNVWKDKADLVKQWIAAGAGK